MVGHGSGHGGKREGAGRPKGKGRTREITVSFKMDEKEHAFFLGRLKAAGKNDAPMSANAFLRVWALAGRDEIEKKIISFG